MSYSCAQACHSYWKTIILNSKIELISVDILEQNRSLVSQLNNLNKTLALASGWHYLMDWAWVITQIKDLAGKTILDAGAGIGLLQWYFALQGARVISVDRSDRTCIPFHLLKRFNVSGFTETDTPLSLNEILNITNGKSKLSTRIKALTRGIIGELRSRNNLSKDVIGSVLLSQQDLKSLENIPSNSVDLVVSISALEHNETISDVKQVVQELMRILKPGGQILATLPATSNKDWFFKPAYSWCFTETTLRDVFVLPDNTDSNYDQFDLFFEKLKASKELKKNLSIRYYYSPNSGMPWGKWKPQYLPVGITKFKS